MSVCRSCKRPVRWVELKSGKKNPLDPRPAADGTVMIVETAQDADLYDCRVGQAVVLKEMAAHYERQRGVDLYRSHFSTCPNAGAHRKR